MNKNHWGGLFPARRRLVLSLVSKSNTRPKRMSPEQKCVIDDGGCGAESEAVVVGESVQPASLMAGPHYVRAGSCRSR